MISKNEALGILKNDMINNINIINFIENYPVNPIEKISDSLIIRGISDRPWVYISCKSEKELKLIKCSLNSDDKNYAVIEDWMIPEITSGNKIKWKLSAQRLYLPADVFLPPSPNFDSLKDEDSCFIYENSDYKDFLSLEYVRDRIHYGISSCIKKGNTPIAWGMTQDDGAIGFLHVLPEHRRKGYGRKIVLSLIHKVRNQHKLPFVHIEEENFKSMKLSLSLGFTKDKIVSWFEID